MQFPYESEEQESEIIERLICIENMLVSFNAQNDLVRELVNKKIYQQNTGVNMLISPEQKKIHFTLIKVFSEENVPIYIRISGRTYDIRDRIKQFGQATWKSEIKAWEMEYTNAIYIQLLSFLQSLTSDVNEEAVILKV